MAAALTEIPWWAVAAFGAAFTLAVALARWAALWGLGEWQRAVEADMQHVRENAANGDARLRDWQGALMAQLERLEAQVADARETLAGVRATVEAATRERT